MLKNKRKFRKVTTAGNSTDTERNTLPSETVPDQAMSMRTIMARFASGTINDISRPVEYSEDMPDLRGLDISQIHDMKLENARKIKALEAEKTRREILANEEKEQRIADANKIKAEEAQIVQ